MHQNKIISTIIHQIRNSLRYIASKNQKELKKVLKRVYQASMKELAEDKLLELLYMGIKNVQEKCTMPIWNWRLTLSQLAIFFEGKLDKELKL